MGGGKGEGGVFACLILSYFCLVCLTFPPLPNTTAAPAAAVVIRQNQKKTSPHHTPPLGYNILHRYNEQTDGYNPTQPVLLLQAPVCVSVAGREQGTTHPA